MQQLMDLTAPLAILLDSEDDDERKVRVIFEVALADAKKYRELTSESRV